MGAEGRNSSTGDAVKSLYYDILNSKGTKRTYQEDENEDDEKKHSNKLNKKRAKALRKQQKKLEAKDKKLEAEDSDGELPFFMMDASIVAARKERALEAQLAAKSKK